MGNKIFNKNAQKLRVRLNQDFIQRLEPIEMKEEKISRYENGQVWEWGKYGIRHTKTSALMPIAFFHPTHKKLSSEIAYGLLGARTGDEYEIHFYPEWHLANYQKGEADIIELHYLEYDDTKPVLTTGTVEYISIGKSDSKALIFFSSAEKGVVFKKQVFSLKR